MQPFQDSRQHLAGLRRFLLFRERLYRCDEIQSGLEQRYELLREGQHAQAAAPGTGACAKTGRAFHRKHRISLFPCLALGGLRIEGLDREIDDVGLAAHCFHLESHR